MNSPAPRTIRRLAPIGAALLALVLATSVNAATGWTGPTLVGKADFCSDVAAAVHPTGSTHVVADCGGRIRYSTDQTGHWVTTYFSVPVDFGDQEPQIAIGGDRIYVAFSRVVFLACGIEYHGAYYRSRTLTSPTWSAARRIGPSGERLESFDVSGSTLHLTVNVVEGDRLTYETYRAGALKRYAISDGTSGSALKVGSDGRARIVYETQNALRYATFTGSGFSKSTIPGTTDRDGDPHLALDTTNHAHVVWTQQAPPGCNDQEPSPDDGTYYATNATGSWTAKAARRISADLGAPSIAVDPATGSPHVVVGSAAGLTYLTNVPGAAWSSQKLTSAQVESTAIAPDLDPEQGSIRVVYSRESDTNVSASIFTFTKP